MLMFLSPLNRAHEAAPKGPEWLAEHDAIPSILHRIDRGKNWWNDTARARLAWLRIQSAVRFAQLALMIFALWKAQNA
jgi:hypothetical protein